MNEAFVHNFLKINFYIITSMDICIANITTSMVMHIVTELAEVSVHLYQVSSDQVDIINPEVP